MRKLLSLIAAIVITSLASACLDTSRQTKDNFAIAAEAKEYSSLLTRDIATTDGTRHVDLLTPGKNNREAVLTESRTANRIANSRPERIVPYNCTKNSRTVGKLPINSKYYQLKLRSYRGRERSQKAPFAVDVACEYYVIALRHIIR